MFVGDARTGKIYVAESDGLSFADSSFISLPLNGTSLPVGIEFDPRNEFVYWTDEILHTINRAAINGSHQEVIVKVASNEGCK